MPAASDRSGNPVAVWHWSESLGGTIGTDYDNSGGPVRTQDGRVFSGIIARQGADAIY